MARKINVDKFQNKYRIPSARLQGWDYRWAGAYFITICTAGREHYFGEIESGKLRMSHVAIIADILWHEIPNHSKNVELGAFVVMPNHIHGILIITQNGGENMNENGIVETGHALSLQLSQPPQPKTIGQKRFQNIGKNSVSSIIGSYKSAVSKHAHRLGYIFQWQPLFHDHIIRNDDEYQRINDYIETNPEKWEQDRFIKPEEL